MSRQLPGPAGCIHSTLVGAARDLGQGLCVLVLLVEWLWLLPVASPSALPLQMPVCSYFLKGICSNSDCPYSHVYVSRKAEVCRDFLKGYCPLGAKVRPQAGVGSWSSLCQPVWTPCGPDLTSPSQATSAQ